MSTCAEHSIGHFATVDTRSGGCLILVTSGQVLFVIAGRLVTLLVVVIHYIIRKGEFLVELLCEVRGDIALYIILVVSLLLPVRRPSDNGGILTTLFEIVSDQLVVFLPVVSLPSLAVSNQHAVKPGECLQVEHKVLLAGIYAGDFFQFALLIIYAYLADDFYR